MTRGSKASLNGRALAEAPGGKRTDYDFIARMVYAKETGTRLATIVERKRLTRSARNANTTDRGRLSRVD